MEPFLAVSPYDAVPKTTKCAFNKVAEDCFHKPCCQLYMYMYDLKGFNIAEKINNYIMCMNSPCTFVVVC